MTTAVVTTAVADARVDKRMSLSDAVSRFVRPGSSVHLAYADARPNAAVLEIVRRFRGTDPQLTLSTAGFVSVQNALVSEGVVTRLRCSFAGENYPSPRPSPIVREAERAGRLVIENWSLLTLVARLMAGALGLPFLPVRSLAGSGMEAEHAGTGFTVASAVLDGVEHRIGAVAPYRPDVTIVQGLAADQAGNVLLAPPFGEAAWGALAARDVIACVERIVPTAEIRQHSALQAVPGHLVGAVCHVPRGSHPYGLYNPSVPGVSSYTQDDEFMAAVRDAMSTPEAFRAWVDKWVVAPGDHAGYLRAVGDRRLAELVVEPGRSDQPTTAPDGELLDTERMVVAAARHVEDRIRTQRHDTVLAGIGYSNLASWLAANNLWRSGHELHLMTEIGMFGYRPRRGEPFIFASGNMPTCTALTGVLEVLGALVGGPASRTLGVLGAGQIDRFGNVNSTRDESGTFLIGSGGANDVASGAREVVVTVRQSPRRLVSSVPYVTSPGQAVSAIVTTEAVLVRRDGEFQLVRYFPRSGEPAEATIRRVVARTGWPLRVADDVAAEPPPTGAELAELRAFDPDRTVL